MTGTMTSADDRPEEWSAGDDDDGSVALQHSSLLDRSAFSYTTYIYMVYSHVLCCTIFVLYSHFSGLSPTPSWHFRFGLWWKGVPGLCEICVALSIASAVGICTAMGPKWFRLKGLGSLVLCYFILGRYLLSETCDCFWLWLRALFCGFATAGRSIWPIGRCTSLTSLSVFQSP